MYPRLTFSPYASFFISMLSKPVIAVVYVVQGTVARGSYKLGKCSVKGVYPHFPSPPYCSYCLLIP